MSWSVAAIGKAPAVRTEIARQFSAGGKCIEPEEGIRQAAAALIASAMDAQHSLTVVKVIASGAQSLEYKTQFVRNNLSIIIEPQYGFVE